MARSIRATCPACAAVLALGESAAPGKKIRCPKCATIFPVPAGAVADVEMGVSARPRRFRPKKSNAGSGAQVAIVAGAILLVAGLAVAGYFAFRSKAGGSGGAVANRPPATGGQGFNIGQTAPDIDGEDIDGVRFKLSDYRGKVVVLDFWGDW